VAEPDVRLVIEADVAGMVDLEPVRNMAAAIGQRLRERLLNHVVRAVAVADDRRERFAEFAYRLR
jgi:hypothetical protein